MALPSVFGGVGTVDGTWYFSFSGTYRYMFFVWYCVVVVHLFVHLLRDVIFSWYIVVQYIFLTNVQTLLFILYRCSQGKFIAQHLNGSAAAAVDGVDDRVGRL